MHSLTMLPIHLLPDGTDAIIADISGPETHLHRLRELGFDIGQSITMVRSGVPCILKVCEKEFAFRFDESMSVMVTPCQ